MSRSDYKIYRQQARTQSFIWTLEHHGKVAVIGRDCYLVTEMRGRGAFFGCLNVEFPRATRPGRIKLLRRLRSVWDFNLP